MDNEQAKALYKGFHEELEKDAAFLQAAKGFGKSLVGLARGAKQVVKPTAGSRAARATFKQRAGAFGRMTKKTMQKHPVGTAALAGGAGYAASR